jgi:hypothetical protein
MARLDKSREKFIIVYVKCFRHYRTKKMVYPIPPKKFIRLKIRADRHRAYLERKRLNSKTAA